MKLYVTKTYNIEEVFGGNLSEILSMLDKDRQKRAVLIRHKQEAARSIFAGLLLRYAYLCEGYGEDTWQQEKIGHGRYGKPYIIKKTKFHYSLSHSGEWVFCAVDNSPIGADIQELRPWKLSMAERFFAKSEYEWLAAFGADCDREQTKLFYKMWTAKESCVKLTGRGIGAGIDQYRVNQDFTKINVVDSQEFPIKIYESISGYMVCVCSEGENFPDSLIMVSLEKLVESRKTEG